MLLIPSDHDLIYAHIPIPICPRMGNRSRHNRSKYLYNLINTLTVNPNRKLTNLLIQTNHSPSIQRIIQQFTTELDPSSPINTHILEQLLITIQKLNPIESTKQIIIDEAQINKPSTKHQAQPTTICIHTCTLPHQIHIHHHSHTSNPPHTNIKIYIHPRTKQRTKMNKIHTTPTH